MEIVKWRESAKACVGINIMTSTTQTARERYDQIIEAMGCWELTSDEFQKLWSELEAIKNEHGGLPPQASDELAG